MKSQIAQVVVGLPLEGPFDYLIPDACATPIQPGQRLYVSFQNRMRVAYVVNLCSQSDIPPFRLKPLLAVLDEVPSVDQNMLQVTKAAAQYYGCGWGEAIEAGLPGALRTKRVFAPPFLLDSSRAVAAEPASRQTIFCHDIGGEGEWGFLQPRIDGVLAKGRDVIWLVPEVQMIHKVCAALKTWGCRDIAILDKALTLKEELIHWCRVKTGEARVVVGTRSAVFAPVRRLGLMIICHEENPAFKQEQSPFYHARGVAEIRQRVEGGALLYVSSAPSAEFWGSMKEGNLPDPRWEEIPARRMGELQLIDLANYKPGKRTVIAFPLQNMIIDTLARSQKTVLWFNRRGFSTLTKCNQCGHVIKCERCDVHMAYQDRRRQLVCYLCDTAIPLPERCPGCGEGYLRSLGGGIEKLQSEVARIFPQARVACFDKESSLIPRNADIIVATQAVLRILPELSTALIGVLSIDTELSRVDFRAAQRVFSLLVRLRQAARDKVVAQTHYIEHYVLRCAQKLDFEGFYRQELKLRQEMGFPPFCHWITMMIRGKVREEVHDVALRLGEALTRGGPSHWELLNPQPDFVPKLRDKYRFHIMLKGPSVPEMLLAVQQAFKTVKRRKDVVVTVNVDP
jgi:primosomal protein N' (replication factor Y)